MIFLRLEVLRTGKRGQAKGVCRGSISSADGQVTGEVQTRALVHVTVGIEDTDRKGSGGATFTLSQEVLLDLETAEYIYTITWNIYFT